MTLNEGNWDDDNGSCRSGGKQTSPGIYAKLWLERGERKMNNSIVIVDLIILFVASFVGSFLSGIFRLFLIISLLRGASRLDCILTPMGSYRFLGNSIRI